MPETPYIQVVIDDQEMDLQNVDIAVSYKLEDRDDFQKKKSSDALSIKFPATKINDQVSNTFHNPGAEDMTVDEVFKSPRRAMIVAGGSELLVGKAFLKSAKHNARPLEYEYDFYGNNADWMIDLQEATLFDFLQQINFPFTKQTIIDSWQYDGRNPNLPYLFAPVRYGQPMETGFANLVMNPPPEVVDYDMKPDYMKPSISKYWLIFWAFKSIGYRVSSSFFDTEYFRRQLMPWTWGNFLYSEGTRQDNLRFLAKGPWTGVWNYDFTGIWDVKADNDSTNGAFDNNGVYEYDAATFEMKWTYLTAFPYGLLDATFHLQMNVDATVAANSDAELRVQWFRNGVRVMHGNDNGNGTELVNLHAPSTGRRDFQGLVDDWATIRVNQGDVVTAKIYVHTFDTDLGRANIMFSVDAFELDFFKIPDGGTIDFSSYTGFKKYRFLDYLRGVVDEFNIAIQTDSVNKVVYLEPTHDYSLVHDQSSKQGGYFNGNFIDWNIKQDLSQESTLENYADNEREMLFKYKDDGNDGLLKVVQDRNTNVLASGKFVFPDRFKAGKKEIENRFFSPVMHYDVLQWKGLGSDADEAPQMICMVPENISNTSRDEAQNTFAPKSVYYKGLVSNVGWVFDGVKQNSYPFMFAVNYKPGGENDPILSYSDEKIGKEPSFVVGKGLLRRFYLQRMAIMRNGQWYNTWFRLNNKDVANFLHREHIICRGQKWELVEINQYKPLKDESTACFLRKWAPINSEDNSNVYPSGAAVLDTQQSTNSFDIKYATLKCLPSDIPS